MADRPRSRSFAPTVALGIAGAAVAAVASARTWSTAAPPAGVPVPPAVVTGEEAAPLALALSLVLLAAWGVVLVVRRRVRRLVSGLGMVLGLVVLGAVLDVLPRLDDLAADRLGRVGAAGTEVTAWPLAALVSALVAAGCFGVAVLRAAGWPEMGSRYDAPGARAHAPVTQQDMWRSLDEGHDPTA